MLELNEVLIDDAENTVSMMAQERKVTCLTGGSAKVRSRMLLAIIGLEPLKSGFICIDGEPLGKGTQMLFRRMMAYVPSELKADGEVVVYEPPTVQDVFDLKENRDAAISNGLLCEEMKRTMAPDDKAQLLAVAVLRQRPILLVDNPHPLSASYLHRLAEEGRLVIVSSDDSNILSMADEIVEI